MRACWCTLAGTKHCDTCPNGPSRLNFNIDTPTKTFSLTSIDLDIPDSDPKKEMLKFLEKFDNYEKEKGRKGFKTVSVSR